MKYFSTRGKLVATTFEEALFTGYADDGGILVPETIPKLTLETLTGWKKAKLSYPQVVQKIIRCYVPPEEIPDQDLENCIKINYGTKFTSSEVIPIKQVYTGNPDGSFNHVKIAELYHGRTASFKDYAMSLIGQLLDYYLAKRKRHTTVVVGTFGDTGSAAMEAVSDCSNIDIIVLYPYGRISTVQELQLQSIISPNIHLFGVEGSSDDLDVPIKKCFPGVDLISLNSINWARIMIQIAHYVYLYIMDNDDSAQLNVVVPTGAAGNLTSGVFASKMGLPINLYLANNSNKCVDTFLSQGLFAFSHNVVETPASAMDIGTPYNIERILHVFSNGNSKVVSNIIKSVEGGNVGVIPADLLTAIRTVVKGSMSVTNENIYETIKNCWIINQYVICPHTATALYYYNQLMAKTASLKLKSFYIISTASPFKFPESIEKTGIPVAEWNGNSLLDLLKSSPLVVPKMMKKGENWYKILTEEINTIRASKSNVDGTN